MPVSRLGWTRALAPPQTPGMLGTPHRSPRRSISRPTAPFTPPISHERRAALGRAAGRLDWTIEALELSSQAYLGDAGATLIAPQTMGITVPANGTIDVVVYGIDPAPGGIGAYTLSCSAP